MKNKRSPRGIALPLILIVLLGVSSFLIQIAFNRESGNECVYEKFIYPAEVILVRDAGSGLSEVLFLLDTADIADTLAYSQIFNGYASAEQLKRKNIVEGEKFQYHVGLLRSGNCPVREVALTLEKY